MTNDERDEILVKVEQIHAEINGVKVILLSELAQILDLYVNKPLTCETCEHFAITDCRKLEDVIFKLDLRPVGFSCSEYRRRE